MKITVAFLAAAIAAASTIHAASLPLFARDETTSEAPHASNPSANLPTTSYHAPTSRQLINVPLADSLRSSRVRTTAKLYGALIPPSTKPKPLLAAPPRSKPRWPFGTMLSYRPIPPRVELDAVARKKWWPFGTMMAFHPVPSRAAKVLSTPTGAAPDELTQHDETVRKIAASYGETIFKNENKDVRETAVTNTGAMELLEDLKMLRA